MAKETTIARERGAGSLSVDNALGVSRRTRAYNKLYSGASVDDIHELTRDAIDIRAQQLMRRNTSLNTNNQIIGEINPRTGEFEEYWANMATPEQEARRRANNRRIRRAQENMQRRLNEWYRRNMP